jgi:hypothetical protein
MKAEELERWLETEIEQARGYGGGDLEQVHTNALNRYFGRPRGNEITGRSAAQSNDIADSVEAIVATALPGFSGDSIVEFEPNGGDDVEQAQQESDAVNNVIVERNRGYVLLQTCLRDALLLRNGWCKVFEEKRVKVRSERFRGVEPAALALIGMDAPEEEEYSVQRVTANPDGGLDATVRVKTTRKRLRVCSVDPVRMSWQADHDSTDVQDIRFLCEQDYPSRSWLIEQGYKRSRVEAAKAATPGTTTGELARRRDGVQPATETDKASEQVSARWIHYRYDSDGDGITEIHRILYLDDAPAGQRVLEDEIVEFIPYATGTPFLQPHSLDGLGMYDKLVQVEDTKTAALRQWLDNLEAMNNSRTAIDNRTVVLQDLTDSRPGGVVRVEGPPGQGIMELRATDAGPSALAALEYQDKIRSERAGASLDMQSAQLQIAGDTAHGVERQYSAKEQMAALICRTLAETLVREMYLLVHQALRSWVTEPLMIRRRGEFVESNPSEWPERERVNVQSGLSIGERGARRAALEAVLAQQEKLMSAGQDGVLVDLAGYHSALMDWSRAAMIDNADRYFLDPKSEASQQAAEAKAQKADQQANIQLQIANAAANAEQQKQGLSNGFQAWKQETDLAFKYWQEGISAELDLLKAGQTATPQIEQQQQEGEQRSAEANLAGAATGPAAQGAR